MVLIFAFFTLWSGSALSSDQILAQNEFNAGATAYLAKDYKNALNHFNEALKQDPNNESILVNLGLTHYYLQQKGLSLGYFRRALYFSPGFLSPARMGVNLVKNNLNPPDNSEQIDFLSYLHGQIFQMTSVSSYLFLGALLFLLCGWLWINFIKARKEALEKDLPLPPFSLVIPVLTFCFLVVTTLTGLKVFDLTFIRATVIAPNISVHTAPDEAQMKLFELHEGFEVIIKKLQDDWVQIKYPGQAAGWIKKEHLFVTTGGSSSN